MSAEPEFQVNELVLPDLDILRLALEQLPDDFALLTPEFNVEWIGPRFAARLGMSVRGAMGRNWFDLHSLASSQTLEYARVTAGEQVELPALPMRQMNGELRFYRTRLQPLWLNRTVRGVLVIEHDLTEKFNQTQVDERRLAMVRTMARGSSDIVTLLDANARVIFISDSITSILGYQPSDLVGKTIFDIVHPDDLADARDRIATGSVLLAPMRMKGYRARHRHADGSWRWIESLAVNALLDPLVASIITYSKDVTETRALEEQLARRERRFATLTERSEDIVVVLNQQFRVSFESASTERVLGLHTADMAGPHMLRLVHRSQRRDVLRRIRDLMDDRGTERRFTFMMRTRDGRYRWIEAIAKDLTEDPDVGGILINARDITDRKLMELELTSALDGGEIALWDQDLSTREIRWLNDCSMRRMIESQRMHHGEAEWFDSIHPDDRLKVAAAYRRFEDGATDQVHIEYRLRITDGPYRWILERARCGGIDPRSGGRRISGVSFDVTDRHNAEDALAETRERFTLALQCAQVGFYERDVAKDVVQGLDAWLHSIGLPATSGTPGHTERWLQRMHPDDRTSAQGIFDRHLAGESSLAEAEYRLQHSDGKSWVWILDRAQVTERDAQGKALRIAGIVMNIDARRELEAAVDETQSRLATAIWGGHFGLWELEVPNMKARWFSDWCQLEGFQPCDEGNHVSDWDANVHPDDLPAAEALFSKMLAGDVDAYDAEYRVRTLKGEWRWISERSRAVQHDHNGKPTRVVGICINIDTRKQSEEALRISEARYRSVAELTPGFIAEFEFDARQDMRIRWASDGFFGVLGMTVPEFRKQGQDRIHPDDPLCSLYRERVHTLMRGENIFGESRLLHRDGSPRWIQFAVRPIRDSSTGAVTSALAVMHDITQRKLAEMALRESQLKLQSLADNSPDWLMLVDTDLRVQFINRPVRGIPPAELVGKTLSDVAQQPSEISRLDEIRRIVIENGQSWSSEQLDGDASEPMRVLLHRVQPVHADGRVVGAVLNTSDVTESVRQQRMLRLQGHILETMREGVVLLDATDRIRITNPSFDSMFGTRGDSPIDRPFMDFLPDDVLPRSDRMAELRRQLQRARSSPLEFDCRRIDGTLFAAAGLATSTVIGGSEHLLLVLSDVTDRKLLEREILEVSNREQQRIGADLHDGLGQELTGVALMLRGLASSIHREYPAAREDIDEIVNLLSHAIEVTRTLARGLSPVSIERGGLLPALRTLAARSSEAYGISVTLRSRMQIEPRIEEGVANHLYRIVQEALSNAMRHGKARQIRIHLASDVQSIRLSVTDNGRGIASEDSSLGGLGLRTMSYRAQVIGGHLDVRRHTAGGTIVRCVCPQGARVAARITRVTPISRESAP